MATSIAVAHDYTQSLPTPLLEMIFACFPFRPRLLAISLACQRWRRIVLQGVTAWYRHPKLAAIALFPQLRSLCLQGRVDPRHYSGPLPVSLPELRDLELYCLSASPSSKELSLPFSSLQTLRLDTQCDFALTVLQASAVGITALHLLDDRNEDFYSSLASLSLPSLKEFAIVRPAWSDTSKQLFARLEQFLLRHPQLTALGLRDMHRQRQALCTACAFPNVVRVSLDLFATPATIAAFIDKCSLQLHSLSLHASPCPAAWLEGLAEQPRVCAALEALHLSSVDAPPDALLQLLSRCPRMAQLSFSQSCTVEILAQLAQSRFAPLVVEMDSLLGPPKDVVSFFSKPQHILPLYSFPNLRCIHCSAAAITDNLLATLPTALPSVKILTCDTVEAPALRSAVLSLQALTARMPGLTHLGLHVYLRPSATKGEEKSQKGVAAKKGATASLAPEEEEALREFVGQLLSRGLHCIAVYGVNFKLNVQPRHEWQEVRLGVDPILFRYRDGWNGRIIFPYEKASAFSCTRIQSANG